MTLEEAEIFEIARRVPDVFVSLVIDVECADLHRRMQRLLLEHDHAYVELPRGHGKTTQLAGRCAWEIGHDPTVRIKVISQTDKDAQKTVSMIKEAIESRIYKAIFPHVQPDRSAWGKQQMRVQTDRLMRDHTVEATTIFGRAGGRADILIGDDVSDWRNSIQQPSLRAQVKDAWSSTWLPTLDPSRDRAPRVWKTGTPYHVDDITSDWRELHGRDGSLLREPVVGFRSPWPEVFGPEYLRETIRPPMGPTAYARAYELMPLSAEDLMFPADWIDSAAYARIPKWDGANGRMVASMDFAFTEKKLKDDPDWSVCLIGWATDAGHLYVVDILRVRMTFPHFKFAAIARCRHHGVVYAVAEGNGPQKGLVQQVDIESPFPVKALDRDRDKITRAADVQAYVEGGRYHLPKDRSAQMQSHYDEITTFPGSGHDDTVDAAVDLIECARKRVLTTKPSRVPQDVRDRVNARRGIYGVGARI